MKYRLSAFFLLFWTLVQHLAAQEVPYIRHFTPQDYRLQNQNWGIAQASPENWLYFANNGGILEFDGATWTNWPLEFNQPVRTIAADNNGRVYCGGFASIGYGEKDGAGQFRYNSLSGKVGSELFGKEEIWHVLPCRQFVLFQSFSTIYKYQNDTIISLKAPGAIMFAEAIDQKILVPVIGLGIYELLEDNTFRLLPGTESLGQNIVQFIVPGPQKSLWIGTTDNGLYEYHDNLCTPWKSPLNNVFKNKQLNKGIALKQGGWAIGTVLDGLYLLDKNGTLQYQLNRSDGLQNNTVLSLLEDHASNLWVGLDKGVDLVMLGTPLRYFTDQSGEIGAVYAALQAGDRLYLGTNQGLYSRRGVDEFQLVPGTQGQVWDLNLMDGQVICGHNSGTFLVQGNTATRISTITGGWCLTKIPGHYGNLVQSTYTGLVIYRKNNAGQWALSHRVEGFNIPLRKIVFDRRGNLWGVHPNRGLYRLRLSDELNRISEYHAFNERDGLPAEHRLDLALKGDTVVLNSHRGAFRIAPGPPVQFLPLSLSEQKGKFLPGVGGDYFLADSAQLLFVQNDRFSELPLSLVPGYEQIVAQPDGNYFFCLENGFALFNHSEEKPKTSTPTGPVLRRVDLPERSFLPGSDYPKLAYSENTLTIQFGIAEYTRQPHFSWLLEGFSDKWSPWQTAANQTFINLPPGNYTFKLRSDIGEEMAIFQFSVLPPWYLSVWALLVYLLGIIAIFAGMEAYNRRRLARQKARIEAENAKEIEHRKMAAEHDKLALEVDNKSRELSNAAFNLIRKNEVLQHLKDMLQKAPDDPNLKRKIVREIDEQLEGDHDWEVFEEAFNRVHDNFFVRLMQSYPDMTQGDLRLAAYLRMNLSSKEIAPLLNMSLRGVENKRYRLRKKMDLPETENLAEFLINF